MVTLRAQIAFFAVILLACGVVGFSQGVDTGSGSFDSTATTSGQTAVFVSYGATIADSDISTAISVSNPLAWDVGAGSLLDLGGGNTSGTVELYLWHHDGTLVTFETSDDSVGTGLSADGTLAAGATWSFLLGDALTAAGHSGDFIGYGWIVANFDGVAATHTLVVFGEGFSQAFHGVPAIGQGMSGTAGLPVTVE